MDVVDQGHDVMIERGPTPLRFGHGCRKQAGYESEVEHVGYLHRRATVGWGGECKGGTVCWWGVGERGGAIG